MDDSRPAPGVPLPHTRTAADIVAALAATPAGLTAAEAARRLTLYGRNELTAAPRVSPWSVLAEQFRNVLVVILLVATALSAFLGHAVEAVAIAVIVTLAILLGFVQEFRAERAMEALRSLTAPVARVLRDGVETEIPARDLVPGDVLVLRAGDRVAGDGRLLEAASVAAQEAALTGESEPVDKGVEPVADAEAPVGDRTNMVFAGTAIARGRGRALVVATGMQTEFGRIARLLESVAPGPTPLQQNLDRLGRALVRAALAIVAVIVVLGMLRGQPFVEMLVFGIALAVAVVPEALPAVVTISLALGVQRLVRRRALIRRLAAVETLGSTSVICSDKTGTLTKDEMTARRVYVHGQLVEVTGVGYAPEGSFECNGARVDSHDGLLALLGAAALASDAKIVRGENDGAWHVRGDPTEGALVAAAAKAGLDKDDLDARFLRVHEIPFESETRRMTTLHATPDGVVAYAKGAPEVLVYDCAWESTVDGAVPLDGAARQRILAAAHAMADDALRVLAVATRTGATPGNAQRDLTFLGLVGMIDPPRAEARDAIATCRRAGIAVVMITGDHPTTARAVARELGLLADGQVVTGADLDAMDDAELARRVTGIAVYARVSPAHKLRVVGALQAKRHVVAMTGDGVNDAPALRKADIGVAMGISGTDVAREAAAMTLTDDNFASIVAAVEEGRGIFGNIKKYLMFLLSSNIGEIGLMAGATLAGMPLPLTAVQILYVNLATDGLPALALAVDPPEGDLMARRPRDPRAGIFTRPVVVLMLIGGTWSTLVNLALFAWAWQSGRTVAEAMTMTFVCLVLIQLVNAYNFRSDRHSILRRPFANRWLNLAVLWELALLSVVVYLPVLHAPFGTFALTAVDWAIIAGAALSIAPVLEIAKALARRGAFGALH
ncbi:MAG: cation-translocating P-type ATPase [Burkholderiales bacterium]